MSSYNYHCITHRIIAFGCNCYVCFFDKTTFISSLSTILCDTHYLFFSIPPVVPVPSVNVTRTQVYDNLLAGSTLTIYCDIAIDVNVDTPFNVTLTWTHNNTVLLSNSRVTIINPYSTSLNGYQSRIEFSTLSSTLDSGTYTCDVSVTSNSDYLRVINSENVNNTTTLPVISEKNWYNYAT